MEDSVSAQLTAQFYDWETRCRGWKSYASPVDVEPRFIPFFHHYTKPPEMRDDGYRHTFLSELFSSQPEPKKEEKPPEEEFDFPIYFDDGEEELRGIRLTVPKAEKTSSDTMEYLLLMLSETTYPVSFEITATHAVISFQIVCREPDRRGIESNLHAYLPGVILSDCTDSLEDIISEDSDVFCTDLGLKDEVMRPLAGMGSLDPYVGLFAVLDHLEPGERATVQVLFKGTINPWGPSMMRAVLSNDGGHFFTNDPDMVPLAWKKVDGPLFGVVIRAIGLGDTFDDSVRISVALAKALIRGTASKENSLIPLNQYDRERFIEDVLLRQSHRLGMLLNSEELCGLMHLPSSAVISKKIERERRATKLLPDSARGNQLIIGTNVHQGVSTEATISPALRTRHVHVIGATGTGKSTLLLNCIAQDIRYGNGVAVLDPHGDLIQSVLAHVPYGRVKDVVLIDPSDAEHPIGFNVLSAHSEIEKQLLSSDLIAIFRRMSTSWGDQMHSVFANAIIAMLDAEKGATLLDLRRFLIEKPFRTKFLSSIPDPSIRYYWEKEYPLLKTSSIGSILTRLDSFLRPKLIRNMVAQKTGPDFEQIMDGRKILLVKLPVGLIGEESSYLLGSFIMSKISLAAFARQAKSKEDRKDFYVYADEFQHFATESMASMLSGTRKYAVSLILSHQDMQQVAKKDSELAEAVATNAGTRIAFRLGDTDAKRFAGTLSAFEATDLQNLGIGEAIVRMERNDQDFNIAITPLPEPDPDIAEMVIEDIIEHTRDTYSTPRHVVEAMLQELYGAVEQTMPEPVEKETVARDPEPKKQEVPDRVDEPVTVLLPSTKMPPVIKKKMLTKHRSLQNFIKEMAESRGYIASIEDTIPNGRIDVSLTRDGKRIACEVCVTTPEEWELHNIKKCLAAGYDMVVACSADSKALSNIKRVVAEKLDPNLKNKVFVYTPEELIMHLDTESAKETSGETVIKGYRVKVDYNAVSDLSGKQKKESIIKVLADSKKIKK